MKNTKNWKTVDIRNLATEIENKEQEQIERFASCFDALSIRGRFLHFELREGAEAIVPEGFIAKISWGEDCERRSYNRESGEYERDNSGSYRIAQLMPNLYGGESIKLPPLGGEPRVQGEDYDFIDQYEVTLSVDDFGNGRELFDAVVGVFEKYGIKTVRINEEVIT